MNSNQWKLTDHGEHYAYGCRYEIETITIHPDTSQPVSAAVAFTFDKEYAEQIMREHANEQQFAGPARPTKTLADLGLAGLSDHIFQFIISRSDNSRPAAYKAAYMAALAARADLAGEPFRLLTGQPSCGCDPEGPCVYHRNEHPFVPGDHRECGPDCAITGDKCCGGVVVCDTCVKELDTEADHLWPEGAVS